MVRPEEIFEYGVARFVGGFRFSTFEQNLITDSDTHIEWSEVIICFCSEVGVIYAYPVFLETRHVGTHLFAGSQLRWSAFRRIGCGDLIRIQHHIGRLPGVTGVHSANLIGIFSLGSTHVGFLDNQAVIAETFNPFACYLIVASADSFFTHRIVSAPESHEGAVFQLFGSEQPG